MGCCHSSHDPYDAPQPASNNARTASASLAREQSNAPVVPREFRRALSLGDTSGLPRAFTTIGPSAPIPEHRKNSPIRPPSPVLRSPKDVSPMPRPWTRSHLERQRREFFETRIGGSREIWQNVEAVCERLRRGEVEEAQSVLDAAGITCPSGRVARGKRMRAEGDRGKRFCGGLYDERGAKYEVPDWVVMDPADIVEDEAQQDDADAVEKDVALGALSDGTHSSTDEDGSGEAIRPKGKGRAASPGEKIRVRVRLSDRHADADIVYGMKQPCKIISQQLKEQFPDIAGEVRLMHRGRALDKNRSLEANEWVDGQVISAFVLGDKSSGGLNSSTLM